MEVEPPDAGDAPAGEQDGVDAAGAALAATRVVTADELARQVGRYL